MRLQGLHHLIYNGPSITAVKDGDGNKDYHRHDEREGQRWCGGLSSATSGEQEA